MKLCLLSCNNQYASKRYFTLKFAEALLRKGVETHILSWSHGPFPEELVEEVRKLKPTLTASFHQLPEQEDGKYFWDRLHMNHWSILVDPVFYDLELMRSANSIISCVDKGDCELLQSYHFTRNFFFPHAVDKNLLSITNDDRPIDVLFLGTCYDPEHLYKYWEKNYSKNILNVLEDAVTKVLTETNTTFVRALLLSLVTSGIDPKEVEFDRLANYVDMYSRGIDRLNLIRSITDVPVHVYGDKCWREEQPIEDWNFYLSKQANVTVHPPVSFTEGLKLLQRSKICLNSMPFFKQGTHERVFSAIACGALPLTNLNPYLENEFRNDEILFYQSNSLKSVNHQIQETLMDSQARSKKIVEGQAVLLNNHTWDQRVDTLLHDLNKLKITTS